MIAIISLVITLTTVLNLCITSSAQCLQRGQQCQTSPQCCQVCCKNGQCLDASACTTQMACGRSKCSFDDACAIPGALCFYGYCNTEPECIELPYIIYSKSEHACSLIRCPDGAQCISELHICPIAPCPQEVNCKPLVDPCTTKTCPAGTVCEVDSDELYQANCISFCAATKCPEDKFCQLNGNTITCVTRESLCSRAGCNNNEYCYIQSLSCPKEPCPVHAVCMPYQYPCTPTACRPGFQCFPDPILPGHALCI